MVKLQKKVEVYDFQRTKRDGTIIIYFYDRRKNKAALSIREAQFKDWMRFKNRMCTVLSCDGENTACEMTMQEYWEFFSKQAHTEDLTDFLNELKQAI